MILYKDKKYMFTELFNEKTGLLLRSNVIINGQESTLVPKMRSYPELIDIGIMGQCHAAEAGICVQSGVDCYLDANNNRGPNMKLKDYDYIIQQCKGKTFQIALGGIGDPNKHENFNEILKLTRYYNMIPNLTTSGYNLTSYEIKLIKQYCGAVAVSFYSRLSGSGRNNHETNHITIRAIESLVAEGCIVNVHFVLSKDTIEEALFRLQYDLFPKGIYAVVFLLYKPVGAAKIEKTIDGNDENYIELLKFIQNKRFNFRIGFDTCQTPALLRHNNTLTIEALDLCESGRFSMYINNRLMAYPCSFGSDCQEFIVDLGKNSIEQAWFSEQFDRFRKRQDYMCSSCDKDCYGCALDIGINSCGIYKDETIEVD